MARVPLATYRLQFNETFRFADARRILDYLRSLGISDLYASPILSSRHGSAHGYDSTDPTRLDPDLGSHDDFAELQRQLEIRGMGLILDVVPNHMAASSENPWWTDVLENGPASPFASYFDIDWHPPSPTLRNKILLPVLGRPFGEALDSGELQLLRQEGRFFIGYSDSLFPLAAHSYRRVLAARNIAKETVAAPDVNPQDFAHSAGAWDEFAGIVAGLSFLFDASSPSTTTADADRRLKFAALRDRLSQLFLSEPGIASFVGENLSVFRGSPGDPPSFSPLERLLSEQHYKLAYWRNTSEAINYRRFFTITDLVGLRAEDPQVFEATHGYLLRGLTRTAFTGFRVDHIDGLRDPFSYLAKLRQQLSPHTTNGGANGMRNDAAKDSEEPREPKENNPPFVLVEKILEGAEQLPPDWPVSGTTGYDYLNFANGLFVNAENGPALERLYGNFIGRSAAWPDVLYQQKKLVMSTVLNQEMLALGRSLADLAAEDRYARETPRTDLTDALIELTAALPVYRTYIRNLDVPDAARASITAAVSSARQRRPQLDSGALRFVRDVLLLANPLHVFPEQREARLAFVMRWQQFTGPIMAKGLEDTALYVYFPLSSLNEVGGDPRPSHAPPACDFHDFVRRRRELYPHSLNATTTHDTKRSEDARMRINALSDIPGQWAERLREWGELNLPHKSTVDGRIVPDRNEEYLLYQTLLAVWPPCPPQPNEQGQLVARVQAYVVKATREAMVHTRWTRPNQPHEAALTQFVARILAPANDAFLRSFTELQQEVARVTAWNSLAQTVLKIAAPGVPDFYQGSELWDLHLVDPDNRTPVDFSLRETLFADLRANYTQPSFAQLCTMLSHWQDGKTKLYVIWKALQARSNNRQLFESGDYIPLECTGSDSASVLAFARHYEDSWAIAVITRWRPFDVDAHQFHKETRLALPDEAPRIWTSVLDQQTCRADADTLILSDILNTLPTALLIAHL